MKNGGREAATCLEPQPQPGELWLCRARSSRFISAIKHLTLAMIKQAVLYLPGPACLS